MNRKDETKWFDAVKFAERRFIEEGIYGLQRIIQMTERDLADDERYRIRAANDYMDHLKHLVNVESSKMVFDTQPR